MATQAVAEPAKCETRCVHAKAVLDRAPSLGETAQVSVEVTSDVDLKGVRIDGKSDIRELRVLGDWAYLRNYLEVTVTPPGGQKPVRRSGYTLTILQKLPDGRWVLARDANLMTAEA